MKIDYPLIIVIAGSFILGFCVGSYKSKKEESSIDLTGAHFETHGWFRDSLGTHVPATFAPMKEDETHTGVVRPTTDQIYELLRLGENEGYGPTKMIYFNEATKKVVVITDSAGHSKFQQLDLRDIKIQK